MTARRIFLCLLLLVGWNFARGAPPRKPSQPDVFLITIDTLRADHVHCYGYDRVQTPALDTLAKNGIRFSQAFTPSPITNTSHTTILTGLAYKPRLASRNKAHQSTHVACCPSKLHPDWTFFFAFAHLARAAFRAISRRCSGESAAALASPPFFAPNSARATA